MSLTDVAARPIDELPVTSPDCGLTRAERAELTAELLREVSASTDADRTAELREQVIVINRGVAEAVAARYRNRGVPLEDLQQVACEGLTKAVMRFDPTLRNDLLTYAVPTIRGELQRYFRDQGWTVRPPRRLQELQWQVTQATDSLVHDLGREPEGDEVAEVLGVSTEEYQEAMEAFGCFQPSSLDQPATTESMTSVGEMIAEDDRDVAASEARVTLAPVVRRLPERDRRILYLRFVEDLTQEQIGEDLGVTQMQVSRLLTRILGTLRHELEESG